MANKAVHGMEIRLERNNLRQTDKIARQLRDITDLFGRIDKLEREMTDLKKHMNGGALSRS